MPKNSHVLYIFLSFCLLGFVLVSPHSAIGQVSCTTGNWQEPTCNPLTEDPANCQVSPPLFANAMCLQSTGYLLIRDEDNPADERYWADLQPAIIQVGDVQSGWNPGAGGIEAYGPVIVGQFSSTPSKRGVGDISVTSDVYAGSSLSAGTFATIRQSQIDFDPTSKVDVGAKLQVLTAGVPSDSMIYVNDTAQQANLLRMVGRNEVIFDAYGYLNANGNYEINSDGNLQLKINADNSGSNTFKIKNGGGADMFSADESGNTTIAGDLEAATLTANSGGVGSGAIRGDFVESFTGNPCSADQILIRRGAPFTPGWYCVDSGNVGGSDQGLLSVLNIDPNAGSFSSGDVSVGVSGGHKFIITSEINGDAPLKIRADTDNSNDQDNPYVEFEQDGRSVEAVLGLTGNVINREPDDSGYTGTLKNSLLLGHRDNYPLQLGTNNNVRLSILGGNSETGGYVGLGTNSPNRRLHVYQPSGVHNAEIDIQSVAGSANWWGIYHDRGTDDLRFWQNGDLVTFDDDGDVGIGVLTPTSKLQVNGNIRGDFTDYQGNNCTSGQVLVYGASGWTCTDQSGISGSPGGSDGQVQYNNGGVFGGASSLVYDDATNRVGIGTNNPKEALHIYRNGQVQLLMQNANNSAGAANIELRGAYDAGIPFIDFTQGDNDNNNPDYSSRIAVWTNGEFQFKQATSSPIEFWTYNGVSEAIRMTIESNGYVGIGITDPVVPLHLRTTSAGSQNILRIDGPTAGGQLQSNDTHFDIVSYGGTAASYDPLVLRAGADGIIIETDGDVGVGNINGFLATPAAARLKVVPPTGNEGLRIISSNYSPLVIRDAADTIDLFRVDQYGNLKSTGQMSFWVNSQSAMSIDTDLVVNIENKLKSDSVEIGAITHTETTGSNSTYNTYGDDGLEYCGGGGGAFFDDKNRGLVINIRKYLNNFFGINEAQAEKVRELVVRPVSNAPDCNPGDTELYAAPSVPTPYNDCAGNPDQTAPFVNYRECQTTTAWTAEVNKIEFKGTPGSGKPGIVEVKDNLVVNQNKWGDGITSNCSWKTALSGGTSCKDGQYVAGFDPTGPRIYCCDL